MLSRNRAAGWPLCPAAGLAGLLRPAAGLARPASSGGRIAQTMQEFGFVAYPLEYWHFDYQEREMDEPADVVITPSLAGLNVN